MGRPEIIITVNNAETGSKMKQALITGGFAVSGICSSGNEAIRKVRTQKPALLIAYYELPDTTGFELAKIITENNLCSVLLLADDAQKKYVESKAGDMDITCLIKPVSRALLLSTAELIIKNRIKIQRLEAELSKVKNDLDTRKLIDKAKGLLMERKGLSESEAYRRIQKQSMDTGIPMKEVSKLIIDVMS